MLEILTDRGGHDDIYHLADDLSFEIDDVLPIVEAASMLGFVKVSEGDVEITLAGHQYVEADIAERKRLAQSKAAVEASDDGMIRLVRMLDEPARKLLKKHKETIDALAASAAERIAQYRFRLFGPADYPDATSTPRVSYGAVKAYHDRTEAQVLAATTFGGLFHLSGDQAPYKLPQQWVIA